MRYYHGTNKLFTEFSGSYSNYSGKIYVSPCKMMAIAYTSGNGYLYEVEINEDDILHPDELSDCGCMAFLDVSKLKIVGYERIEDKGPAMWKSECGKNILRVSRNKLI